MHSLDEINSIREIYYFVMDRNEELKDYPLDWGKIFLNFAETASKCALELKVIKMVKEHRRGEVEQKKRRMPSAQLEVKINNELEGTFFKMQVHPDANRLFFPGKINDDTFFHSSNAKDLIFKMLHRDFSFPENLSDDLDMGINCALSLFGAFSSLAGRYEIGIPFLATIKLLERLSTLLAGTKKLVDEIDKAEKIADQNSRNQKKTDKKELRIKEIKLHPRYQEVFQAMEKYRQTRKSKDKLFIDMLIAEITGRDKKRNPVTIRCYRNDLLDDYLNY
ncbi:MAG: hypothetical protein QG610_640 [Euryarchaeota archaeon]|nr:hypothetical protein [Euryarchaeota archaeon]